jgi:hypothetical protein
MVLPPFMIPATESKESLAGSQMTKREDSVRISPWGRPGLATSRLIRGTSPRASLHRESFSPSAFQLGEKVPKADETSPAAALRPAADHRGRRCPPPDPARRYRRVEREHAAHPTLVPAKASREGNHPPRPERGNGPCRCGKTTDLETRRGRKPNGIRTRG